MALAELGRTFVLPSKLAYPGPRPVRLTIAGRVLVAAAGLLCAGAVVAGVLLQQEARRQVEARRALVDRGVIVSGEVVRLWPSGEHWRRVRYQFAVDGVVYENQMNVSSEQRR